MKESEVELILQRAREKFPETTPRIISDNGPQFIAKDFKEFIRICGMTHVKTSPYYPQSNGKIERWASIRQARMHSSRSAVDRRGCTPTPYNLHRALQYRAAAQCDRLRHSAGQDEWTRNRDLYRARPQAGASPTAKTATSQCFLIRRNDLTIMADSPIHAEPGHEAQPAFISRDVDDYVQMFARDVVYRQKDASVLNYDQVADQVLRQLRVIPSNHRVRPVLGIDEISTESNILLTTSALRWLQ